jgi:hypothetical protein
MPTCNYVAKSVEARYEYRKFFATVADLDHDGVDQNRQGRGGVFLFSYHTDLLEYFVGKKG